MIIKTDKNVPNDDYNSKKEPEGSEGPEGPGGPEEPEYHIPPKCLIAMLAGAGIGIAGMGIVTLALPIIGFGALGPTAGSFAAWSQSVIGAKVATGSAFALLQSLGMAGWSLSTGALITGSSATLALTICQALGLHQGGNSC